MMLGWGLRGFIGGGPFGAMIPGALVVLALGHASGRRDLNWLAAMGAIGVAFGGEMTYGQTVGFIVQRETFWWGFLGLALKGGVWGLLAGAFLAIAFTASLGRMAATVATLLVGTELGWRWVNEPKLIYFSNPLDKPRAEIWAGLLLAGLLLALGARSRLVWRFAAAGFVGGFVGFGGGGAIQGLGRIFTPQLELHWWKYMEFFFGFCFGVALWWAWTREELPPAREEAEGRWPWLVALGGGALLTAWLFWGAEVIPVRYGFLVAACPVLLVLTRWPGWALQVAATTTFTAFAFDLARHWSRDYQRGDAAPAYGLAVVAAVGFSWVVERRREEPGAVLLWLLWGGVAVALGKFAIHPQGPVMLLDHVAFLFVVQAVWITRLLRQEASRAGVASSTRKPLGKERPISAISS